MVNLIINEKSKVGLVETAKGRLAECNATVTVSKEEMQDACAVESFIKKIKQTYPKLESVTWSKTGKAQAINKQA